MTDDLRTQDLESTLEALGRHLQRAGKSVGLLIVGGAALVLAGCIERGTSDVDVLALAHDGDGGPVFRPPHPFPEPLRRAISAVAADFMLPQDWMNAMVAGQWKAGLPACAFEDIRWRTFGGGLRIGIAGRRLLIHLKLFAATDHGEGSEHFQDLLALDPDESELSEAGLWVIEQDTSEAFRDGARRMVALVRERRG